MYLVNLVTWIPYTSVMTRLSAFVHVYDNTFTFASNNKEHYGTCYVNIPPVWSEKTADDV